MARSQTYQLMGRNAVNTKNHGEIFPRAEVEPKPRKLRQAWLKDVGYDEAPWFMSVWGY